MRDLRLWTFRPRASLAYCTASNRRVESDFLLIPLSVGALGSSAIISGTRIGAVGAASAQRRRETAWEQRIDLVLRFAQFFFRHFLNDRTLIAAATL